VKNQAAVALGRLGGLIGGKSASAKKQAAARQNGCKGGRPKEAVVVCLSTLKAYYASTLGELHVHGKQVGNFGCCVRGQSCGTSTDSRRILGMLGLHGVSGRIFADVRTAYQTMLLAELGCVVRTDD
jgi:hypothetical protein